MTAKLRKFDTLGPSISDYMTYNLLLIGMPEISIDTSGLDIKIDKMIWEFVTPFQKYDMIVVDNSSIDTKSVRIAIKVKGDFLNFVEKGGVLVCLSSQPKNYGGYRTYDWLPFLQSFKLKVSKLQVKSLKIKRSMYERFIENQQDSISGECLFSGFKENEHSKVLLTTGLDEIIAFSTSIKEGMTICLPQFKDKTIFLRNWLEFWISKKPDWVEKFQYKEKRGLLAKLKTISTIEKLLYGNDRELRNAVIEAFRFLGFDARPTPLGTQQDIDLTYGSFTAIVEVKGLKSHADLDDMRALLDYYDANIAKRPNLKGIFVVNHYREVEPGKKEKPYTESALDLARRKGFCLLTSDDLYFAIESAFVNPKLKDAIRQRIMKEKGLTRLQP